MAIVTDKDHPICKRNPPILQTSTHETSSVKRVRNNKILIIKNVHTTILIFSTVYDVALNSYQNLEKREEVGI